MAVKTFLDNLPPEDLKQIKRTLIDYRDEGMPVPLLPLDVDVDGDGICDSFGLDENDEVVFVSGVTLGNTVYVSEGDDVGGDA